MHEIDLEIKKYKRFWDILSDNYSDSETIIDGIKGAIALIAPALGISSFYMEGYYKPDDFFDYNNTDKRIFFYGDEIMDDSDFNRFDVRDVDMVNNVKVKVFAGSVNNDGFTGNKRIMLEIVMGNIALLIKHSLMLDMLKMTPYKDDLTGLLNTSGNLRKMGRIYADGKLSEYAAVFFNIRNFKFINQTVGVKTGDVILKEFAFYINSNLKEEEYISRLGGDNFFALVKKERADDLINMITYMKLKFLVEGKETIQEIESKSGLYFVKYKDTPGDVMNCASTAYYYAKKSNKYSCVWFKPYMITEIFKEKEISHKFRDAIDEERFTLYYQPKIDLETNTLCGCEALVRWKDKDSVIDPGSFIPVLEKEGSVRELDYYNLNHVCSDIRRWLDIGLEPVRASVNFSKIHLYNERLAGEIINTLKRFDVDSRYIEIEITEMSGYDDFSKLKKFVEDMKGAGISISIDDFGTGYSSLNMLTDLDIDIVKLDKSFVDDIDDIYQGNKGDEIVIRSIISMVTELGMKVIAEGVETEKQLDFLKEAGCHMIQGFIYDKPLEIDEFEARLKDKHYVIRNDL